MTSSDQRQKKRILSCSRPSRSARESVEMNYEFTAPFVVDSSRITDKLGASATPVQDALAETLAGYRTATT